MSACLQPYLIGSLTALRSSNLSEPRIAFASRCIDRKERRETRNLKSLSDGPRCRSVLFSRMCKHVHAPLMSKRGVLAWHPYPMREGSGADSEPPEALCTALPIPSGSAARAAGSWLVG